MRPRISRRGSVRPFVCLFVYQAESTWGVLDRNSASLAALPGEASPTRACLGAIAGHRNGNGEMSIPYSVNVVVLSCVVRARPSNPPLTRVGEKLRLLSREERTPHSTLYLDGNNPGEQ